MSYLIRFFQGKPHQLAHYVHPVNGDDIASIIRLQGKKLDAQAIDIAAARLGLLGVWRALWSQNQPP